MISSSAPLQYFCSSSCCILLVSAHVLCSVHSSLDSGGVSFSPNLLFGAEVWPLGVLSGTVGLDPGGSLGPLSIIRRKLLSSLVLHVQKLQISLTQLHSQREPSVPVVGLPCDNSRSKESEGSAGS